MLHHKQEPVVVTHIKRPFSMTFNKPDVCPHQDKKSVWMLSFVFLDWVKTVALQMILVTQNAYITGQGHQLQGRHHCYQHHPLDDTCVTQNAYIIGQCHQLQGRNHCYKHHPPFHIPRHHNIHPSWEPTGGQGPSLPRAWGNER